MLLLSLIRLYPSPMEPNFINKEIKGMDKWVAYVVHHTWIKTGIFIVAFLEATISPLLPEIVVAAVLTYRKDLSWKLLSLISSLGSTLGMSFVYLTGKYLYASHKAWFEHVLGGSLASYTESMFQYNTFVSMFLAALTPLPDRIFAFLAGVFSLSFLVVFVAVFLGRLVRVSIVAYFSYHFGDEARVYILKHTKRAVIIVSALAVLYILLKVRGIL